MNTSPVLLSKVSAALANSPIGQLRRLIVIENDAEVIITGAVSSYYFKQMAQETVRYAVGGRRLFNHVEVYFGEAA